ncbi:hypothetical protein L6452_04187 [Arctium lappa]|uniref:Uncharacterized protein n=1 Tax=Arctium lappa TaxID=4217 RepID=A0ACB9FQI7_ARCLA|nr:hypothetical protein L6452_04187 [Arctium lappa]
MMNEGDDFSSNDSSNTASDDDVEVANAPPTVSSSMAGLIHKTLLKWYLLCELVVVVLVLVLLHLSYPENQDECSDETLC